MEGDKTKCLKSISPPNEFAEWTTLTSLGEELRVDALEGLLADDSGRALGLEAAVDSLELILGEARGSAQRLEALRAVPGRRLQVLELRVWNTEPPPTQLSNLLFPRGATVAQRLACSPRRTGFNPRPGHSRTFASGNRAGRCRWSAGFLGDLPFPPPLYSGFQRRSIFNLITLIGSQDLAVKSRPNISTQYDYPSDTMRRYSDLGDACLRRLPPPVAGSSWAAADGGVTTPSRPDRSVVHTSGPAPGAARLPRSRSALTFPSVGHSPSPLSTSYLPLCRSFTFPSVGSSYSYFGRSLPSEAAHLPLLWMFTLPSSRSSCLSFGRSFQYVSRSPPLLQLLTFPLPTAHLPLFLPLPPLFRPRSLIPLRAPTSRKVRNYAPAR
ncbi:hypothetical protein PR048_000930 [Dryococelus australis]|uniref:Uncharacterized protein n=1 Tax=Dryococelus australis TaxID=614101 RepID=A0ABQ9IFY3_9NEOP|nr:hypothetical protein PR048_000930 [Dryococelus australis]